jgi:hypothetical protein
LFAPFNGALIWKHGKARASPMKESFKGETSLRRSVREMSSATGMTKSKSSLNRKKWV